ncbi:MAG: hypothetical protein PVH18_09995 [Chloroflexota bacterium]|jgi:hypothetical protein
MTQMIDIYSLELLPVADEEALLQLAQQEGFSLAAVTRAGTVTRQYLLREYDEQGTTRHYRWVVHWTLHFEEQTLPTIGPSLWKIRQRLEELANITSFKRHIQLAEDPAEDGE